MDRDPKDEGVEVKVNVAVATTIVLVATTIVLVVAAIALVLMEVAELEISVANPGRFESAGSVVYAADKPVTFWQMLGGGAEPATKLTAAHCKQDFS